MKILITGVSGYIGSCLYYHLKQKFKIFGIDKINTKLIPVKKLNLLDIKKLDVFLKKEKPNLVIHLAAQSLVDETINKKKYFLNNVTATKNLIYIMKKNNLDNLIFFNTAALYKFKNKILTESCDINPKSTYAKTKYECEKIIKNSKLNSIILRGTEKESDLRYKNYSEMMFELTNPLKVKPYFDKEATLLERQPVLVYRSLFTVSFIVNMLLIGMVLK